MAVDLDQLRTAAQRVAASHDLDVVDLDFAGGGKFRALRVFVEKNALGRARLAEVAKAAREATPADDEEEGAIPSAVLDGTLSIEHLSGVTHEDCEQFSRDFGMLLDVEDLVPGAEYTLEVSSPGLDRKLSQAADYERFAGSLVKLQTFTPVAGNRHWKGRIVQRIGDKVVLDPAAVKQKSSRAKPGKAPKSTSASTIEIEVSNVERANLVPEF